MRSENRRNHRRVRVLTLNVWGLAWPLSRDLDARIDAIGKELAGMRLDIAALQEVWTEHARQKLIALGSAAGLRHAWFPPDGAAGLLILSTSEITDARFSQFHLRGLPEMVQHSDYWGRKGVAIATIDCGDGQIALATTHLHASYRARSEDEYVSHRTGQVVQLAAEFSGIEAPLIALGDFNIRESLEEYRVLHGLTGLRDLATGLDRRQPTILASSPYRDREAAEERIDYVFHRDGTDASLIPRSIERVLDGSIQPGNPPTHYSDHAGLLAEFERVPHGARMAPVDTEAVELARTILATGRQQAVARRSRRVHAGGVGTALAGVAGVGAALPLASRRRFLRACCIGAAGLAAASAGTNIALACLASPEELQAYDTVLAELDGLA